jgi:hypothetical protein
VIGPARPARRRNGPLAIDYRSIRMLDGAALERTAAGRP